MRVLDTLGMMSNSADEPMNEPDVRLNSGLAEQTTTVVMVAFACEPGRGSEPGVGYEFARGLAMLAKQNHWRAVLLTRTHRLDRIRAELKKEGLDGHIRLEGLAIPLSLVATTKRRHVRVAALYWQLAAVRYLRHLAGAMEGPIIVHHVTFASEFLPTFEWLLPPRVLRIFGPAGSAQTGNRISQRRSGVLLRESLSRLNLRRVDLAVAQNTDSARRWSPNCLRTVVEPNVVVHRTDLDAAHYHQRHSLRVKDGFGRWSTESTDGCLLTVGLLVKRKRHHLAIQALAKAANPHLRLFIVGGGVLERDLMEQARSIGVANRVFFTGQLTKQQVFAAMANARVLIHSSRQEGAGWVVGEAQSFGLPAIAVRGCGSDTVVELGGIGEVVDNNRDESVLAQSIAGAVDRILASKSTYQPSTRWLDSRIPGLLEQWYRAALGEGAESES